MKLLNLGCGNKYHKDWINIDFVSNSENVISHNLLKGIPIDNNNVDVVYHSHVLEHFSKRDGLEFLKECFRVLKTKGVIRIAIPDLETIAKEYLKHHELAIKGDVKAQENYQWIKLELLDQMVRNHSGGEMKSYLFQSNISNETYVFSRLGKEAKALRSSFLSVQKNKFNQNYKVKNNIFKTFKRFAKRKVNMFKGSSRSENSLSDFDKKALEIGRFRLGGEIHQWMYDRYSLTKILQDLGFVDVKVCDGFNSQVENWEIYQLDVEYGELRKPDSLFIEAIKP